MQVQPYIFFEGRCEEALNFYKKALNAEVTALMRFSEMPPTPDTADQTGCASGATPPPPDSVMHASFKVGETEVMASDGMSSGKAEFKGISLSLSPATEAEGKKLFAALSEGGEVQMPAAATFFSPYFGMVADKFGVSWMVVVPGDMPAQ
jgi:PhnB protein